MKDKEYIISGFNKVETDNEKDEFSRGFMIGYNSAIQDIKSQAKEYKEPDYISIFSIPAGKEFINFDISGFPNKFVDKKATIKIYLEE